MTQFEQSHVGETRLGRPKYAENVARRAADGAEHWEARDLTKREQPASDVEADPDEVDAVGEAAIHE